MKKIQYNVVERDTGNASGKAKKDVAIILEQMGYKKMYKPSTSQIIRVLQQLWGITKLKNDTLFFVQYPANVEVCYRYLSRFRKIKKIAIIHDLESLRKLKTVEQEYQTLSMFDAIISHNPRMTDYLIICLKAIASLSRNMIEGLYLLQEICQNRNSYLGCQR